MAGFAKGSIHKIQPNSPTHLEIINYSCSVSYFSKIQQKTTATFYNFVEFCPKRTNHNSPSVDTPNQVQPTSAVKVGMSGVIKKFFLASMFMWMAPVVILYAFNHDWLPGVTHLSPHSLTLLSGFLVVMSVNVVIAFYICMAMKEPTDKHEPDPAFVADAKSSIKQLTGKPEDSSQSLKKE